MQKDTIRIKHRQPGMGNSREGGAEDKDAPVTSPDGWGQEGHGSNRLTWLHPQLPSQRGLSIPFLFTPGTPRRIQGDPPPPARNAPTARQQLLRAVRDPAGDPVSAPDPSSLLVLSQNEADKDKPKRRSSSLEASRAGGGLGGWGGGP